MNEQKHLTYFKIENFKCFESFEMNDIGQFNLIVGDNNVGKTTLLEALLFDENLQHLLLRLRNAFAVRNNLQFPIKEYNLLGAYFNKNSNIKSINYFLKNISSPDLASYSLSSDLLENLNNNEKEKLKSYYLQPQNLKYIAILKNNDFSDVRYEMESGLSYEFPLYNPYIWSTVFYSDDLIHFYAEYIQKSKETKDRYLNDLKIFIPDIEDVELSTSMIPGKTTIFIRLKGVDSLIPLSMFGDGSVKLFRILAELKKVKNHYLLIDEIDSGIHFSRMRQFLEIILKTAKANNVQIFATTHSLECLKYFKEVLEEDNMKKYQNDVRHFLIKKLDDGKIKSYTYNFGQFESAIDLGNEIRG